MPRMPSHLLHVYLVYMNAIIVAHHHVCYMSICYLSRISRHHVCYMFIFTCHVIMSVTCLYSTCHECHIIISITCLSISCHECHVIGYINYTPWIHVMSHTSPLRNIFSVSHAWDTCDVIIIIYHVSPLIIYIRYFWHNHFDY